MSSLYGRIGKKYVEISNKITPYYENTFGWDCNIYYPINAPNPNENGNYDNINIFATHGVVKYNSTPSFNRKYYIPYLFKKESMLSSEDVFDNFYTDDAQYAQPFIETTFSEELPIMTKVEILLENSKAYYMIEKKIGVDQPEGKALIRMFLIPMTGELPNE